MAIEKDIDTVEVTINDITLRIPPQQIDVRKDAHNNEWQTLRTTSSQKAKSGHSTAIVTLEVIFEGPEDRANQLAPLVAGLRATPICVIYSEYLESILGTAERQRQDTSPYSQYKQFRPMAFVISNMSFSTMGHAGMPDCISATFSFLWFNYFPYMPIFAFKTGDDYTKPGLPKDSPVWKAFYQPFLANSKLPEWPHDTDRGLTTASFQYREFALLPQGDALSQSATEDLLQTLKNQPAAFLKEYQSLMQDKININSSNIYDSLYRNLIHKNLNVNAEMRNRINNFQAGNVTTAATSVLSPLMNRLSQTANTQGVDAAVQSIKGTEQQTIENSVGLVKKRMQSLEAMGTSGNDVESGDMGDEQGYQRLTKFSMEEVSGGTASITGGLALMGRKRRLDIVPSQERAGNKTIIEQINLTFQNIIAVIPMAGYRYPTAQHIGSIDTEVTFVINATEDGVSEINKMYDMVETMALEFRQIPQGFLNLFIQNDFLDIFGIKEYLTNRIEITTIPEQPGRSRVVLSLTDGGVTSRSKINDNPEGLNQEYIRGSQDIYKEIWKILGNYLREEGPKSGKGSQNTPTTNEYYLLERYNLASTDSNVALAELIDEARWNYNRFLKKVLWEALGFGENASMEGFGHVAMDAFLGVKQDSPEYGFIPGLEQMQNAVRRYNIESSKFKVRAADIPTWTRRHSPIRDAMGAFKPTDKAIILSDMGISEYQINQRNLFQKISDSYLTLTPALQKILKMKDDLGLSRGLMSYPDFRQQIQSVASMDQDSIQDKTDQLHAIFFQQSVALPKSVVNNEIKLMNYEPDAYLWYPIYHGGNSSIDSIMDIQWKIAAEDISKKSAADVQQKTKDFYKDKYLPAIGGKSRELLKEQKKEELMPPIYLNSSWKNSANSESANSETEKITLNVFPDAMSKIYTNFPDQKRKNIQSAAFITHTTSLNECWDGIGTGTGTAPDEMSPPTNYSDVPSKNSSGPWLGIIEGIKIAWPRPDSTQEPRLMVDGTYYCPVAYYRELLHKEHPNYTRDIGVSSEAGAWGQRRKNAAKDWQTSSSLLANQGWYDPNKAAQEMFGVPVSQWTYSQYIDWKGKTGKKIGYIHKGVDIAVEAGVDVYAALDGTVRGWHYAPLAGLFIEIDHNGPAIGQTRYLHLQEIDTARIKPGAKVKGGQCIAVSGRSGQVYMGAHLHFETWTKPKGSPGTKLLDPLHKTSIPWQNGTASKAARYNPPAKSQEKIDKINTQSVQNDLTSGSTSILKLSIDEFEKDLLRGQAQSLLRAYPTFKLYFIEDDSGDERKRLQFDDFFSYNAVQSIRVIRSRKIAADLCEIVLTNVSGVLSNRKYRHDEWDEAYGPTADKGRDATGRVIKETSAAMEADTKKENPMASFLLQEGTNISLRMGYSSDPDRLETVFNGVVMEVDISESDDLIRIVAQSYAVELVQDIKGLEEAETTTSRSFFGWDVWGFWSGASTGCILENMISQPEVLHFGRWYHGQGSTANRELLTNKWHIRDLPQDDNIFAPSKSVDELKQMGNGLVFKDLKYTIYQTTIWDIFKEMELRHPNFIAAPVPYKDTTGERMTMFFGLPNQLYFARAPTGQEQSSQEILKRALENKKDAAIEATSRYLQSKQASTVGGFQHTADERGFKNSRDAEALVSNSFREARLELAKKAGYIRPFRSYHLITAGQHIISNNIKATSRDIYNTIAIKYSTNGGHWVTSPSDAIKTIAGTGDAMFTLKLDSALPTEETRTLVSTQLNVSNEELAKRYALALLSQSLKETYQGDITIIGNPKMKPTDICLDGSTLISVEGGVKPIKEIKIGDFVYTHRGRLRRVCQLFQNRSSGSILQIKCKTDPDPLIITANHPILSLLREEVYDDDRPWIGRKLSGYSPLFRRADSLKKMDYICIPRIKSQESLDFALARLIGLYLAEGSIVWENRKTINRGRYLNKKQPKDLPYNCHVPVAVQWSFNSIKEAYMLEEINSLLAQLGFSKKATGVTDSRSNGWSIIFYDRDFSDLIISLAGYNTQSFKEGKFLKNFYDTETSKFILGGYFDGDGSQTTTIRIGQLCSGGTSLNLGHCIHQLLINVGIPPSSSIYRPMEKNSFGSDNPVYVNNICKFYSNLLIPYCKYIKIEGLRAKTNQTSLIDEDFSYIPISSLEKIEYDQPVYNIGVEEDNSYLAANKAVHNCYVFDDYNDMIGPIEIEQVTHVFDQDQGFRTEIKPNMLVHASEFSILHSCEAMGVVMEGVVRKWWGHRFLAPVANVIGQGFGLFGGFLATKVLNYTQLSCPMIMTPMMHHGRIFAGGIPTRKLPLSVWRTIMGDWSPANDASYADWKQSVYDDVSSALGTAFMQHTVGDFWKNGPNLITNENTLSAK